MSSLLKLNNQFNNISIQFNAFHFTIPLLVDLLRITSSAVVDNSDQESEGNVVLPGLIACLNE